MIVRTGMTVKAQKEKDDSFIFVASMNTPDRSGDLVEQRWDLRAFRQNPLFLWRHGDGDLPIGKITKIWVEKDPSGQKAQGTSEVIKRTMIQVVFADHPFAQEVKKQYEDGFLRAVSVGFRALETADLTAEEREARGMSRWGQRFVRNELLEVSAVPIPMHPGALKKDVAELVSRGFVGDSSDDAMRRMEATVGFSKSFDVSAVESALEGVESHLEDEAPETKTADDMLADLVIRVAALEESNRVLREALEADDNDPSDLRTAIERLSADMERLVSRSAQGSGEDEEDEEEDDDDDIDGAIRSLEQAVNAAWTGNDVFSDVDVSEDDVAAIGREFDRVAAQMEE